MEKICCRMAILPNWAGTLPLFPAVLLSSQVNNTCNHSSQTGTLYTVVEPVFSKHSNHTHTHTKTTWQIIIIIIISSSSSIKHVLIGVTLSCKRCRALCRESQRHNAKTATQRDDSLQSRKTLNSRCVIATVCCCTILTSSP